MTLRFSLFILVVISTLNFTVRGDGHRHVIIHVPYKIHTIHHTITKHIHHHDQNNGDKYEVIGYTIGNPIDMSQHLGNSHEQIIAHHVFGGNNELDNNNSWMPSYGQHELTRSSHSQIENHIDTVALHEFAEHDGGSDGDGGSYGGYD